MKTWVRKTLKVGVLSAGLLLIGGAAAGAAHANTSNNFGIGTGNQIVVPVQIPVNISGNAIGVLGTAQASGSAQGSSTAMLAPLLGGGMATSGNYGLLSGNQALVPVQIPINISGNAIGVLGGASAMSHGAGAAHAMVSPFLFPHLGTGGNFGILSGNQVLAPVLVPIDVCGNAIGVLGNAYATCTGGSGDTGGGSTGGGGYTGGGSGGGYTGGGSGGGYTGGGSGGGYGTGGYATSDTQPVGNQVAKRHQTRAQHQAREAATTHAHRNAHMNMNMGGRPMATRPMSIIPFMTGNNFAPLAGNQIFVPIQIPINISQNAISVLGSAIV